VGKIHEFMEALDVALEFAGTGGQPAQMKQE